MDETDVVEPQQLALDAPHVPEEAPPADDPAVVALREQLLDSQRRETEANAQRDAANARFDQYLERPSQTAPAAQAVPRVDPLAAPDPAIDIDGFNRHNAALRAQDQRDIDARILESTQRIEQQSQAGLSRMQEEQRASNLWGEFRSIHPEHAHQERIAAFAFREAFPSGMPADTSGVIAAVKSKMEELIGTPTYAPNRTGGVGGGSTPPRSPAPKKDEPIIMGMVELIAQQQLDDGLI